MLLPMAQTLLTSELVDVGMTNPGISQIRSNGHSADGDAKSICETLHRRISGFCNCGALEVLAADSQIISACCAPGACGFRQSLAAAARTISVVG